MKFMSKNVYELKKSYVWHVSHMMWQINILRIFFYLSKIFFNTRQLYNTIQDNGTKHENYE